VNRIHVENLFAAILVSQDAGMKNFEIEEAIKRIKPLSNRGRIRKIKDFTVIDETYNSNPMALEKTLSWVDQEFEKLKIAVIGDMLELGEKENDYHFKAGRFFSSLNFSLLITVGKRSEKIADGAVDGGFPPENIVSFVDSYDAGKFIFKEAKRGSVILFKASRGIALENAIKEIENG
jgi:UDP-N-acetylmuramoyl-tripeptide--D-alanyl-D-alanine ligase